MPPQLDFPVSQKIYGRLLLAYPRAHRAAYGAAMAQLFRDQCRDAWTNSGNWGLVKLWLRVLPDLVSTSILERLAALNERKSMTDKLANLFGFRTTPATAFFRVFVLVFIVVFGISVVITFMLPESYASTARITVESDAPTANGQPPSYDPYFLQTTFEILQSQLVLGPVIEKLKLDENWGKKYFAGKALDAAQTLELLKRRLDLRPVRNTKFIAITVYSEDRMEAAQIANGVAESYRNYRIQHPPNGIGASTESARSRLVQILDQAVPGIRPVRPNKPLNIFVGAITGTFLASLAGALSAILVFFIQKRLRKTVAAT